MAVVDGISMPWAKEMEGKYSKYRTLRIFYLNDFQSLQQLSIGSVTFF